MLRYGAAAQIYQNYRTDRLVTDLFSVNGFDLGDWGSNATHTVEDNAREVVTEEGISKTEGSFTAVGLRFDYYNQIFIKFKAEDVSKIQIAINDSLVEDLNNRLVSLGGGVYALYTDGMTATEFDEIYTFELYVNGSLRQMMTYSANSYVYAKGGDLTEQDESNLSAMAALVRALYRYGQSAEAYIG